MKRISFVISFLFFYLVVPAQNFTLEPIPSFVEGPAAWQPLIAFAEITNHTDTFQTVRWQRIVEDIPVDWNSHVCTPLGCILENI